MNPQVEIVIVNWNSGTLLRRCLESVVALPEARERIYRLTVVDNASRDGSANDLDNFPFPFRIIRNPANEGFAAACNVGAEQSDAAYLLFLNPDTQLVAGALTAPIDFMEHPGNRRTGIVGIQLIDETGMVTRTSARFPTPWTVLTRMLGIDVLAPGVFPSYVMTEWDHRENRKVDHVIGAFFFVRRTVYETLDGFDERFFVYLEDVDFSLRARRAGWESFYLADVSAYHTGGGTSAQVKSTRLFYALRSRIRYGYKHFGPVPASVLLIGTAILEPFARLGRAVVRGSAREAADTVTAFVMLWRDLLGWR
jgi:GT2 family glycosyltransferase